MAKETRGQLSSIDKLPVEANPAIHWAAAALIEREQTQEEIRIELNRRLEEIGCYTISRTAFNRYSTRKASLTRELAESREVAKAVVEALGPDAQDETTVLIVQLIKQASLNMMQRKAISSKEIKDLGQALNSAMSAQRMSAINKEKEDEKQKAELAKAAQVATDAIMLIDPEKDPAEVLNSIRKAYGFEDSNE